MKLKHRTFTYLCAVTGILGAASSARAQVIDLRTSNGGFTAPNPNNFIGAGVWQYVAGTGWSVNGRNRESAQLLTNVFTATGGEISFAFNHSFNLELNLFGGLLRWRCAPGQHQRRRLRPRDAVGVRAVGWVSRPNFFQQRQRTCGAERVLWLSKQSTRDFRQQHVHDDRGCR